jgi:hypothetical protein
MLRSPHVIAAIVTIVAVGLFLVLKTTMGFQFGLRTYWPAFACLYLLVWYYMKVVPVKKTT